jgi:hypothetical protein
LETSEIAKFIHGFNTAAVSVFVIFAVCAVFVILGKALKRKTSGKRLFLKAFCVASLVALALEATVFNYPFYLKYFAGQEVKTLNSSPDNPNILRTTDGTVAELIVETGDSSIGLTFKGLNRKVTSIYIDLEFVNSDMVNIEFMWIDEESTRSFKKKIYKHFPHDNYAVIQPYGEISGLTVMFTSANGTIAINHIVLNKQIPFYFSGLRLFVVSFLFFAVFLFFNKKLRARMSYYLFECKFNPASNKQNLAYVFAVVLLIIFSLACAYTSLRPRELFQAFQYNKYLVDAFMEGRTWLDHRANVERLLSAERPYDINWLALNGYQANIDWVFDWAYYKGKHYCYFGAVPAVILYVPYKMITGDYLSNHAGVFLFTAIAVVLLALLWRYCVKRYMPDATFAFYLLSFLALFFASGQYATLRFPLFYAIVQSAAFMFAIAGILLLLKSVERNDKINRLKLFFACLCFALIVGCRPNMIFVSLLVPVVLWKRRSWKLLLFISIPYIIVAIPLMMYNYARFDSVFEFGANYNLTNGNMTAYHLLNPIGKIIKTLISSASFLFAPNEYSLRFPFVIPKGPDGDILAGTFHVAETGGGIINFPIVFCLFYLLKNIFNKKTALSQEISRMLFAFLIIAAAIIILNSFTVGFLRRYTVDFAVFIILPSLWSAYYWCGDLNSAHSRTTRLKAVYVLLAASIFVGLFSFVPGVLLSPQNPVLYRYLECSLGVIREF